MFRIIRNDIVKMDVDAIVNTANPEPIYGGGTDAAIYEAAGVESLLEQRQKIGYLAEGEVAITPGFNLNAKYIIHASGPVWIDGSCGEKEKLESCYKKSLELAKLSKCESIAFPLISTGTYGYPKSEALHVALEIINDFLSVNDMDVYLVVFCDESYRLSTELMGDIDSYIDSCYVEEKLEKEHSLFFGKRKNFFRSFNELFTKINAESDYYAEDADYERSLDSLIDNASETFQQMLLRYIEEKGYKNVEVYGRANMTKQTFAKIKKDVNYHPQKKTAFALAIALRLNLDETMDFLARAGYAFSPCSKQDIIVKYFIETREYNIYEVDIVLEDKGCETLTYYPEF